jgi:exonuclease VII small subunit
MKSQFGTGRVSVSFARTLERELNAAQQRIKQLEDENDAMRADLLLWQ